MKSLVLTMLRAGLGLGSGVWLFGVAGCGYAQNERLEVGALERTGSFAVDRELRPLDDDVRRTQWATVVFLVPIDGIAHGAAMRVYPFPRKTDEPRVYGLMPSVDSSLEYQRTSGMGSVLDTLDEVGSSGVGLLNPMLLQYQLTNTQWSPQRVWKRSRQELAWASGPIAGPINKQEKEDE
jgi:hypothetical protein